MASITSTGIGSNLDIESIITKLMTAERQPITSLQTKEASYQSKVSAFGTLKNSLSTFQAAVKTLSSASAFRGTTSSIADSTIATVSSSSSATTGSYSLKVSKLAQAQTLVATGQASTSAAIGTGTITISLGSVSSTDGSYTSTSSKTITVDSSNNSLTGIRDAINDAGLGVTASIVNDGSGTPYRLTLTANNTGSSNVIKVSASDTSGSALSDLLTYDPATTGTKNLSQTSAAQDAELEINGIAIKKSSNSITDAITGVTLNLLKTNSTTTSISVSRDTTSVTSAVNNFVSAYNTISNTLKQAMAYDADTKTAAILNGESSVRSIQTQLRAVLNTPIEGGASALTLLSQVGVTTQKDGTLSVDSTKLQKALSTNFNDFAGLFAVAGKTTDAQISFTDSTSKTKAGNYEVFVTSLATHGNITGASITAPVTIGSSNNTMTVQLNGTSAEITLASKTYASLDDLAAEIQSEINGASAFSSASATVKVTASAGKLTLTSDLYGSSSTVSFGGGSALTTLGLSEATAVAGENVKGTINGVGATGSGQVLTGASGDASEGIKITVSGGSVGVSRGTVKYSQGYADRFNKLVDDLLDDDGAITSRTKNLNSIIKRLEDDQEKLSARMTTIEKRYRAQFTALDTLMSSMSTTSSYLTQQITALQNLNKQSSN
ncbi:MAG: flagellar hook protein FliD [Burkholderiaceae bacterium]|nr:flagellar hook protein FliD [Burkholderiaceae bacterium]